MTEIHPEVGEDFENNRIYLSGKDFRHLLRMVASHEANDDSDDPPFKHTSQSGVIGIKVLNHVGLVTLPSGTAIEILPKIAGRVGNLEPEAAKGVLLMMLRSLKDQPFRKIGSGDISSPANHPLLEVFIASFIQQCKDVIRINFKSSYSEVEDNERFLRGKLILSKNIRVNLWRKDRFWCGYSEFNRNIAQNRVLKAALLHLTSKTRNGRNLSDLQALLHHMEGVEPSTDLRSDIRLSTLSDRLFSHYTEALNAAKALLGGRSFSALKGQTRNISLLYPMELVFQNYVADQFKRHAGMSVHLQHMEYHLVDNHKGRKMFNLKPDMYIHVGSFHAVLDTKWKLLKHEGSRNYKINEVDMYQMFAYAVKYSISLKKPIFDNHDRPERVRFAFLYPAHAGFEADLEPFHFFENGLSVRIIPFDLFAEPESQVARVINLIY